MSDRVKNIIKRIRSGESVSSIAKSEKLNRYSVSLIKQTLELIEQQKEQQKEQKTEHLDEINKLKDENKKLKFKVSELLEQNKKLSNRLNENRSFLKCITEHKYEFLSVLFGYAIIFMIIVAIALKGG